MSHTYKEWEITQKRLTTIEGSLSSFRQFLATKSPLKMMKNAFYSPSKLFSVSRYLNFCLEFLVIWKNGLIRKTRLISKFMMLQPG